MSATQLYSHQLPLFYPDPVIFTGGGTSTSDYFTVLPNTYTTVLGIVTGVNAKTVANTTLFTVPTGKTAIVTSVVVRCTAATAITAGPTVNISTTATGDIFASVTMSALSSTTKAYIFTSTGGTTVAAATTTVKFNLTAVATGTSQVLTIMVIGYLV